MPAKVFKPTIMSAIKLLDANRQLVLDYFYKTELNYRLSVKIDDALRLKVWLIMKDASTPRLKDAFAIMQKLANYSKWFSLCEEDQTGMKFVNANINILLTQLKIDPGCLQALQEKCEPNVFAVSADFERWVYELIEQISKEIRTVYNNNPVPTPAEMIEDPDSRRDQQSVPADSQETQSLSENDDEMTKNADDTHLMPEDTPANNNKTLGHDPLMLTGGKKHSWRNATLSTVQSVSFSEKFKLLTNREPTSKEVTACGMKLVIDEIYGNLGSKICDAIAHAAGPAGTLKKNEILSKSVVSPIKKKVVGIEKSTQTNCNITKISKVFECRGECGQQNCNVFYLHRFQLNRHIKLNQNKQKCSICSATLKGGMSNLTRHLKTKSCTQVANKMT